MKIRSNIKSGIITMNHNEKTANEKNDAVKMKNTLGRKLRLSKETVRELNTADLKQIAGGAADPQYVKSNTKI